MSKRSAILWLMLLSTIFMAGVEAGRGPVVAKTSDFLDAPLRRSHLGMERLVTLSNRSLCAEGDTQPLNRVNTTVRVESLVALLNTEGYSAYIIPTGDEHQSEYPPERDQRRPYISGFTGSAGTAVVLANGTRALWTDGRYFLGAEDELDCDWLLMKSELPGVPTIDGWLMDVLQAGDIVAADARLIGYGTWNDYQEAFADEGIVFVASDYNLVDAVWDADAENPRPEYSNATAFIHDLVYAGQDVASKLVDVRASLTSMAADGLFVTALDEVAWLYNIRGADVLYNPVVKSYALVTTTEAYLYVDADKIVEEVQTHLESAGVTVMSFESALPELEAFSLLETTTLVLLPDNTLTPGCSYEVYGTVNEIKRSMVVPPTLTLKAQKNAVEIQQMIDANILDGVALCDWLAYIETQVMAGMNWTELSAQNLLTTYRESQEGFVDLSFTAISGYGPNGAIIHYSATEITDLPIGTDSLYLIDSGGQYLGATTDVTRTLHYGTPTAEMIEMYTRVLQGTIDFGTAVFPDGTSIYNIDILARRYLYEVGLDYRHGTSHGIGMFLSVHEPRPSLLQPRQVMSDEPGYYVDGEYGIRLENQIYVQETGMVFDDPYYTFGHMTLVPFEPKLIDLEILTDDQIAWLNVYNIEIRDRVGPVMLEQNREDGHAWLWSKTEPYVRLSDITTQCPEYTTDGAAATKIAPVMILVAVLLAVFKSV